MPKPRQRESSEVSIDSSPPASGLNHTLKRSQRLTQSSAFSETFAQRKKWVGKYMILWLRHSPDASLRIGLISSKKVHLRANKRNRARRHLREAYRQIRPHLNGHVDLIFVARRSLLQATWNEIKNEMHSLLTQAELLEKHPKKKPAPITPPEAPNA
jgi:ribonuclease P protein component